MAAKAPAAGASRLTARALTTRPGAALVVAAAFCIGWTETTVAAGPGVGGAARRSAALDKTRVAATPAAAAQADGAKHVVTCLHYSYGLFVFLIEALLVLFALLGSVEKPTERLIRV